MKALLHIVLSGLAVLLVAKVVPGIHYQGDWVYLILTGVVVGLLNLTVKPLVTFLSLPFIVLTLGFFFIVINACLFGINWLATGGDGGWWAVWPLLGWGIGLPMGIKVAPLIGVSFREVITESSRRNGTCMACCLIRSRMGSSR